MGLELEIEIGDLDWGSELGIGNRDWTRIGGLGFGIGD